MPKPIMNFFERQDKAQRMTKWLIFFYVLAVLGTFFTLHSFVVLIAYIIRDPKDWLPYWVLWSSSQFLFWDGVILMFIMGSATLYKIGEIHRLGGDGIALKCGGTRVDRQTATKSERQLLNIVEEMAIASGINMPNVYVMKDEMSINAFAAGWTPTTSAIAVTQGALVYLNRDELQGVIGHEFSHILHQDISLNLKLIGLLHGVDIIMFFGLGLIIPDWSDLTSLHIYLVLAIFLGVPLFIIGLVGRTFSNIIRFALLRQREFLADASSAQYTRNPLGLANALKKIGCPELGSKIKNKNAIEASHLFLGSIFPNEIFSSHPNLAERIRRLDPSFDGHFPQSVEPIHQEGAPVLQAKETSAKSAFVTVPLASVDSLVDEIGHLTEQKIQIAAALLEKIPDSLIERVSQPEEAAAALFAVYLDARPTILEKQKEILNSKLPAPFIARIEEWREQTAEFSSTLKTTLIQLAFPEFRKITKSDYQTYRSIINELAMADGKISLLEFTIFGLVIRDLDLYFDLTKKQSPKFYIIESLEDAFLKIVSFIAHSGNDQPEEARRAFEKAISVLNLNVPILPKSEVSPADFAKSLSDLTQASFPLRRQILMALYSCIAADGVITEREGELIRAVTAHLECPMPVWTEWANGESKNEKNN